MLDRQCFQIAKFAMLDRQCLELLDKLQNLLIIDICKNLKEVEP